MGAGGGQRGEALEGRLRDAYVWRHFSWVAELIGAAGEGV